jgi:hypothetical protein
MTNYCFGTGFRRRMAILWCVLGSLAPLQLAAQDGQKTNPPPFDFTDQYYLRLLAGAKDRFGNKFRNNRAQIRLACNP